MKEFFTTFLIFLIVGGGQVFLLKKIDRLEKNQKVLVTELNRQRDDMNDLYTNQKNLKERVDQSLIITLPSGATPSSDTDEPVPIGAPHDWMHEPTEQQIPISPADGRFQ